MPPALDIYILCRGRDRHSIERFIDSYVDRVSSQDRGDEELMILPLGAGLEEFDRRPLTDWDWEPARSLTAIIERGLQTPHRAFTVSLSTKDHALTGAILSFTPDGSVLFGLSLDDEGAVPENLVRAKALLAQMAQKFGAIAGYIGIEQPPPWRFEDSPWWVYHWRGDSTIL